MDDKHESKEFFIKDDRLVQLRESDLREMWEYLQHDSWRCGHYKKCHCGLDELTNRLGLDPIPLP